MGRCNRFAFPLLILAWISFFILPVLPAQETTTQDTNSNQTTGNKNDHLQRPQRLRELEKDGPNPYKAWLEQDVVYIITDEERAAFLQLRTNEEREQFIEQFWMRRDPTPDTPENEFKDEHYRRIAYANAHFATGVPGRKTDRGRIYIIWGPPDEIESHPTAGTYERPKSQGGGTISAPPFEQWTYRHMEGIGDNVTMCFIDPSRTGEYYLSTDPGDANRLVAVTHDDSSYELGKPRRQPERVTPPAPHSTGQTPDSERVPARIEVVVRAYNPPPVKFKDLEEITVSRIQRNDIKFCYRFDFLRVTAYTALVPITVEIPSGQLSFPEEGGVPTASLNLYARISSLTGRTVDTFEDVIHGGIPDSQLEQSRNGDLAYQKTVPLCPGLYRLDIVIKDVNSNKVGIESARLTVPPLDDDTLGASTLILADQTHPVTPSQIASDQFVIGDTEVRPKISQSFTADQPPGIYLQIYNFKADRITHKNDALITFHLTRKGQNVITEAITGQALQQSGTEMTIQDNAMLSSLAPGQYHLEIQATDQISKQTIARATDFTIAPLPTDAGPQMTPEK